jgi:hypothetical protein
LKEIEWPTRFLKLLRINRAFLYKHTDISVLVDAPQVQRVGELIVTVKIAMNKLDLLVGGQEALQTSVLGVTERDPWYQVFKRYL